MRRVHSPTHFCLLHHEPLLLSGVRGASRHSVAVRSDGDSACCLMCFCDVLCFLSLRRRGAATGLSPDWERGYPRGACLMAPPAVRMVALARAKPWTVSPTPQLAGSRTGTTAASVSRPPARPMWTWARPPRLPRPSPRAHAIPSAPGSGLSVAGAAAARPRAAGQRGGVVEQRRRARRAHRVPARVRASPPRGPPVRRAVQCSACSGGDPDGQRVLTVCFVSVCAQIFAWLKIHPPRGLLLHGPPDTGKTAGVRAVCCMLYAVCCMLYWSVARGCKPRAHPFAGNKGGATDLPGHALLPAPQLTNKRTLSHPALQV
jgi:hypothetical protein